VLGQTNNVGRGPLGVPTNSPVSDAGTSARIQNRPNVPIGTTATQLDGRKLTARLGGNREQGTDRFPVLKLGSRGGEVQRLQRLLNLHLDAEEQLKLDGYFGPTTREAVLGFQKEEDLRPDGVVGRDTWFSLISAGTQEVSWKAKPPAAPAKVVAAASTTATKKTVDQWTLTERFEYVLQHCGPYLGPDVRAQFTALLTPTNLGIMVGSLVVWAAGHFFGVSEIADAFLLGFGLVFLGRAAIDAARLLKNVIEITSSASSEAELEDAAKDLAEVIAIIGVMTFFALLAKVGRAIGNKLKAGGAAGEAGAKGPQTEPEPQSEAAAAEKVAKAEAAKPVETVQEATKGKNVVKWYKDSQGRTIRAEAKLRESFSGLKRAAEDIKAQKAAAELGKAGDVGGHMVAHRFIGDLGKDADVNLFPQEKNFNNSAYKTMENELSDAVKSGKEVNLRIGLEPPGAARPDIVKVSYEVVDPATGETIYYNAQDFANEAGQTFDRVKW